MIPPLSFSGGTSGAGTGGSSARSNNSGWTVAAPGSIVTGSGGLCPWLIVGGGLVLFLLWRRRK